uniref:CBM20 domain-containing protein n=1 Tax=Chromera velia CCMP2878 TaxID=1169474 RepID=A0A0G4FZG7_9ALVE|eukprot:Cvel_19502.t1-p1 / transcript=Cvel_19502.t1 / gene=Cvel_19502 / organism=Chromera_velia_CCMP2878 / gene_product=Zinc finger protein 283, putative / transcript_product=Zinc finger protein 283, putative / location=Cvel_scaffold1687:4263-10910(-) / protein_length=775 / sequence_SO=supercontig / SO=protein_coding / is_pseudo=false
MIEAETGCVLFACSGVEPREGQTLVVVGNSSDLGGWDASRGAPLHRVKNPAFAGLWMCFPMLHSARSHVRFQFALVGPGADTVGTGSSACGGMALFDGGVLVGGCRNSSAVTSSAAPTDGRSQECYGCAREPLGCGLREVEVVGGGFALFGGRWGNGETQVTPLGWEDMVFAQQQLEQDAFPSVSSEIDGEGDRQAERGERSEGGGFGGPPEGSLPVRESDTLPVAPAGVLSSSSLTCVSSGEEGGGGHERGHEVAVQSESVFVNRRSTADGRQSEGVGGVLLRESGRETVRGGGVAPASKNILVTSAQFDSLCVSTGQCVSANGVMGEKKGHDHFDDERCRFAPVCVGGERGVGVLRGRSALTCGGASVPGGHQSGSDKASSARECEGTKRRRLSSPSCAVSESHEDWTGGDRPSEPGGTEGRLKGERGACQTGRAINPFCPSDRGQADCTEYAGAQRGCHGGRKRPFASNTSAQQQHETGGQRDGGRGGMGVDRTGHEREGTEEVKRNRHGKILCPHGRQRSKCKDCGGKGICEHGRQRSDCKECGGASICEHGRRRTECKECGGGSICEHGRRRTECKECGGASICEHGRERYRCKECGGKSICEHDALPSIILAKVTLPAVLTDFRPPALPTLRANATVRTDALSSTVFAEVTLPAVLTDARPSTLLALVTLPAVFTDFRPAALPALSAKATVRTDALSSTVLALRALTAMLTDTPPPALLARIAHPSMQTQNLPVAVSPHLSSLSPPTTTLSRHDRSPSSYRIPPPSAGL